MPFLTGSLSYRSFRVLETPPEDYLESFTKSLKRYAFKPIPETSDALEAIGWTNPRNLLDTRLRDFDWHFSPYVLLGLRRDKKSIPKAVLRAQVQERVRRLMKQEGRGGVSRDERADIEKDERQKLLTRIMPSSSLTEIAWNLERGRLYVASSSATVNDIVVGLMNETFNVTCLPQQPYLMAEQIAQARERQAELERLTGTDFTSELRRRQLEERYRVQEVAS